MLARGKDPGSAHPTVARRCLGLTVPQTIGKELQMNQLSQARELPDGYDVTLRRVTLTLTKFMIL